MLTQNCFWLGLQILLIVVTVQPDVILTPNKKVLGKLARKFVVERLVNEIVDFWIQAAGHMSNSTKPLRDGGNNIETTRENEEMIPFKTMKSWEIDHSDSIDNSIEYKSSKQTKGNKKSKTNTTDHTKTSNTKQQPMKIEFVIKEKTTDTELKNRTTKVVLKDSRSKRKHKPTSNLTTAKTESGLLKITKPLLRGSVDIVEVTTKKQRTEFDQYVNFNFKAQEEELPSDSVKAFIDKDESYFTSEEMKKFWLL